MLTLDVLIQILSRLPPKSLLRLKTVNKSWNALISDPKFVTKHLSISLQQKYILFKRRVPNNSDKKESIFSIFKFPLDQSVSISVLDIHFPFHDNYCYLDIISHSHGLVCLNTNTKDIFLCNMTTRHFRKLPPSIILFEEDQYQPEDIYERKYLSSYEIGFGYDVKSKDFKVVRVLEFYDGFRPFPRGVEIYDLSKDRWREIEATGCGFIYSISLFDLYHEGTFYWWACNEVLCEPHKIIQTFNFSEEVFGKISYPESVQGKVMTSSQSLGILNGSVVLFVYPYRGNEKTFDIWEMEKDESGAILWLRLFTIGPISRVEYPLLFVSSDELLMECMEGDVILYNIKTRELKDLPIKGLPEFEGLNRYEAIFFVKSFLSVEGTNVIS